MDSTSKTPANQGPPPTADEFFKEPLRLQKITIDSLTLVLDASAADPITAELLGANVIENVRDFLEHAKENHRATRNLAVELRKLEART